MTTLKKNIHSVTAFAPATCANIAVGFDILGFALDTIGDTVTLTRRDDKKVIIESIDAVEKLPSNTLQNTASYVVKKLCQDLKLAHGFSICIKKGIPLSSGMGGSAASAVAALVACNAFLKNPLTKEQLVSYAVLGEKLASGHAHADNVVPCVYGGLTLIQSLHPLRIVALPIPAIVCVLMHPHLRVETKHARAILKKHIAMQDYVKQSALLASFITAIHQRDMTLLKHALRDHLIEPQRAQLVSDFYHIQQAAFTAGALGCSFSGSGPSIFAWAQKKNQAAAIAKDMQKPLKRRGIETDVWITKISQKAARVIKSS